MEVRATRHVDPDDVAVRIRIVRAREGDGGAEREGHLGEARKHAVHGFGSDHANSEARHTCSRLGDGLAGMDAERARLR